MVSNTFLPICLVAWDEIENIWALLDFQADFVVLNYCLEAWYNTVDFIIFCWG